MESQHEAQSLKKAESGLSGDFQSFSTDAASPLFEKQILHMQRQIGNTAVQRLLATKIQRSGPDSASLWSGQSILVPGARQRWTQEDREMLRSIVSQGQAINGRQATQVPFVVTMLPEADYQQFRQILSNAQTDLQRGVICKALTQINSHTMAELVAFAQIIRSMEDSTILQRMNVIDETTAMNPGNNPNQGIRGITQQFSDSCVVTSFQAFRAQQDPIYAFQLTQNSVSQISNSAASNPSSAANPTMTTEQSNLLTDLGGNPVDRGGRGGRGVNIEPYGQQFNKLVGSTGVFFTPRAIPAEISMSAALRLLQSSVEAHIRVPIRIASPGHSVLVIGYDATQDSFRIHDPWNGVTLERTRSQFQQNQLSIASQNTMTHVFEPNTQLINTQTQTTDGSSS